MLVLKLGESEYFDEETQKFVNSGPVRTVRLQHSLLSMSKWEEKWELPFLESVDKSDEQTIDYIHMMAIDEEEPFFHLLTPSQINEINEHINKKATATTIEDLSKEKNKSKEVVTSELIYFWVIAHDIPWEFERWHLNRLMTLIQVCNIKQQQAEKGNKMSPREIAKRNRELNAQRREQLKSRG